MPDFVPQAHTSTLSQGIISLVSIHRRSEAMAAFSPVAPVGDRRVFQGIKCSQRQTRSSCSTRMVATTKKEAPALERGTVSDPLFGRVLTAMVTPFKRGGKEVDYAVAEQLAAHLVENGSDALVIAGTTGESPTLTWSEQYELFSVVRDAVGKKAKVMAGAGSNSTDEAIEATQRAKKLGLDGTLQVVPYYNKPPQEGIFAHFKAIAEAEPDFPMMLYNIPSRTGVSMAPQIVTRLSAYDNIVAVKHATDNFDELVTIRKSTPPDFHIYSGDDGFTLPFLSLGATGVVSVASHFVGRQIQEMVRLYVEGDVAEATAIHHRYSKLFNGLFCMTNPIPTKTALRLQGWSVGPPRLPLVDAPEDVERTLADLLRDLDLL